MGFVKFFRKELFQLFIFQLGFQQQVRIFPMGLLQTLRVFIAMGRVMNTRKIAKNTTTVSLPSANSHASRTVAIAASCR